MGSETDTELDKHVVNLSQDIIDDFPSSDPRWAESRQGKKVVYKKIVVYILLMIYFKRQM